jgi:hypothetical protein
MRHFSAAALCVEFTKMRNFVLRHFVMQHFVSMQHFVMRHFVSMQHFVMRHFTIALILSYAPN